MYIYTESKAILCTFCTGSLHFTSNISIHCLRGNIKSNNFVALQCIVPLSALISHNNPNVKMKKVGKRSNIDLYRVNSDKLLFSY